MEVLQIHGREFVKASKAARDLGYAADYIGQLCRSGAIRAERVGRGWYVDAQEIARHKQSKQRSVAAKSRASLVKRVSLVQHVGAEGVHTTRAIQPIEYADDDAPLVPPIEKRRRAPVTAASTAEVVSTERVSVEQVLVDSDAESNESSKDVVSEDATRTVPVRAVTMHHDIIVHEKRSEVLPPSEEPVMRETFSVRRTPQKEEKKQSGILVANIFYAVALAVVVVGLFVRVDGVVARSGIVREYRFEMVVPRGVVEMVREVW